MLQPSLRCIWSRMHCHCTEDICRHIRYPNYLLDCFFVTQCQKLKIIRVTLLSQKNLYCKHFSSSFQSLQVLFRERYNSSLLQILWIFEKFCLNTVLFCNWKKCNIIQIWEIIALNRFIICMVIIFGILITLIKLCCSPDV